jgi:DNA polymerase-3 subunit alpha
MMSKLESQFIEGCVKTGKVDRVVAEEIFSWTRESQKYSFNRSHAVSYAMNGYRTAYLKSHYPVQFFAAWLLGSQWKSDPQRAVHEMVNDARNFGIIVNPPSLLFANPTTHIHNNQIYFGVGEVNGIGKAGLVKTRKVINEWEEKLSKPLEKFSPSQFIIGIANNINNTVAEALIWSGAVDWLRMSRTSLIFYLQQYKKLSKGEKVWCENNVVDDYIATLKSCGRLKKEGGGIHSKNRLSTFASIVDALENPPHSLEDNRYKIITKEKQYLGISLTLSQSDMYHLQKHGNTNCGELNEGVEGNNLLLPCTIVEVSTTITRKGNDVGKEMAFINVEDGFGVLDGIIAFAQSWQNCKDSLYVGNNVVMRLRSGRDCYFLESVYTEDAL